MEDKKNEIRKQVFELRKKIEEWDNAYYNLDAPTISDEIYDKEIIKLQKLENEYSAFFSYEELKSSPTQKINAKSLNIFEKVTHAAPMLSLNKAYSIEEIIKFIDNVKKITSDFSFFIEPKIDGLSISLKYINGKLVQAVTRGDGITGEDVTQNVLQIEGVPKEIDYKKELEVRGEVFLSISNFNILNKILESNSEPLLANPRNAAAGTLRQLNPEIVKQRKLSAFLYYIIDAEKHNINSMQESFEFLKKMNFNITTISKVVKNIEEIEQYIAEFKAKKELLDYEVDGIVIKVNELNLYPLLGQTQKFPHSAIAFKYSPNIESTKIEDIFITIGRTGLVTYNAKLTPVKLSGSLITYATLNNFNYVKELNLNIGDEVYIKKAGEIIPCVISLVNPKIKLDHIKRFTKCPYCGSTLKESDTNLEEYCLNQSCPEIIKRKLIHFASLKCLNFFSMGERVIERLIEKKLLSSPIDFFFLKDKINEMVAMDKMGKTSVMKILDSIEQSKSLPLDRMISALSIKHIGEKISKFIASKILKLENLLTYDYKSLILYNEIGEKIIESIIEWTKTPENIKLVNSLLELNINNQHKDDIKSRIFENMNFVITGTLSQPRSYYENLIKINNGNIQNSVSNKTTYVIYGENPGSKLKKATELGIKMLTEKDFFDKFDIS
ncbi:NAD-dependent DNA ligase LigA [Metamycoplasma hyosynoviae]|uniref:DNA ligase n=1 Tax=Metamycoplasma hyosynoviae TaxID=29559 RepID=A0A4R7TYW3_9BACT|nr:NAD-dependent DNA ligase LigA [Metamycoplasma hyosynoviae]TDU98122.1 DNA ligase (NAD+) [Metamycoplasma hyosynoviae]